MTIDEMVDTNYSSRALNSAGLNRVKKAVKHAKNSYKDAFVTPVKRTHRAVKAIRRGKALLKAKNPHGKTVINRGRMQLARSVGRGMGTAASAVSPVPGSVEAAAILRVPKKTGNLAVKLARRAKYVR